MGQHLLQARSVLSSLQTSTHILTVITTSCKRIHTDVSPPQPWPRLGSFLWRFGEKSRPSFQQFLHTSDPTGIMTQIPMMMKLEHQKSHPPGIEGRIRLGQPGTTLPSRVWRLCSQYADCLLLKMKAPSKGLMLLLGAWKNEIASACPALSSSHFLSSMFPKRIKDFQVPHTGRSHLGSHHTRWAFMIVEPLRDENEVLRAEDGVNPQSAELGCCSASALGVCEPRELLSPTQPSRLPLPHARVHVSKCITHALLPPAFSGHTQPSISLKTLMSQPRLSTWVSF